MMAFPSKIKVNTRFFASLRDITGRKEDQFELEYNATIQVFLQALVSRYGRKLADYVIDEKGTLKDSLILLVNGKTLDKDVFTLTQLQEGDMVVILPPIGGG